MLNQFIKANFAYERNEPYLLNALGLAQIGNKQEENNFLSFLYAKSLAEHFPNQDKVWQNHVIIIVQGGFCDVRSAFCYRICPFLKEYFATQYNDNKFFVFFREHDEHKSSLALVNYFKNQGCKVILIGHSWGGSSASLKIACNSIKKLDLLITLDPVGIFRPTKKNIPNTKYWLNIYVDYKLADYSFHNNVARAGRPWEFQSLADENISSEILQHEKALDLLKEHALELISKNFT